jgi:REP element-mobilizing transposase RayT
MEVVKKRTRGYLPHWEREGAVYFITFRLRDSLPVDVRANMRVHTTFLQIAEAKRPLLPVETLTLNSLTSRQMEAYLDAGAGECILRRPQIAEVVASTLKHAARRDYDLLAWCVMPNHIHVLCKPFERVELAAIVRRWKSFSAMRINQVLGRKGSLWQREYFDRLIRSEDELYRAADYIRANPIRAGLQDWRWIEVSHDLLNQLSGKS